MRAILIGAVESSRVALERIAAASDWDCSLVVTLPPEKSSRHSDFVDLGQPAAAAEAELLHVRNINDPDAIQAIGRAGADAVFVVGWSQICGEGFREAAGGRVVGYHPAPLPRLRGRGVIPWTILNQEAISGGTLFWIDEGVDSGPILAQRFFHVAADETAASLYAKHMDALASMMDDALAAIASGNPPRNVQDERYATWAARRTPADGLIDWARPASEIERLVRAVGRPYPGAQTFEGPHRLIVWSAEIGSGTQHLAAPGQVVWRTDHAFAVMCGDGALLEVREWEHAGERAPANHVRLTSTPALTPGASRLADSHTSSGPAEARRA